MWIFWRALRINSDTMKVHGVFNHIHILVENIPLKTNLTETWLQTERKFLEEYSVN